MNVQSPILKRIRLGREGMSLIVVLGLLAALTGLAATFALIMRQERAAGRGMLDQVRARHMIPVALNYALDAIHITMVEETNGYSLVYPNWANGAGDGGGDAMASSNIWGGWTSPVDNAQDVLLGGGASNAIPRSLWSDATNAAAQAQWIFLPYGETNPLGRVAYLVINVSGLHDANALGALGSHTNLCSSNIVDGLDYDIVHTNLFYQDYDQHRRYESLAELLAINEGVNPVASNLFVFSYDPDPDVYFEDSTLTNGRLGTAAMLEPGWLHSKTNVNLVSDPVHLTNHLAAAGITNAMQAAGNIVNYLNPAWIESDSDQWSEHSVAHGGQAVPLINEVALRNKDNLHEFTTELWFPFYPTTTSAGQYTLQVEVFTNAPTYPVAWHTNTPIPAMCFVTNAFHVFTNTTSIAHTNWPIYYTARVETQTGQTVNETMGDKRPFTNAPTFYSVSDPRANRSMDYWDAMTNHTLGAINENCDPWADNGPGLPIFHRGDNMRSIAELRHIYLGPPWRHIDLLDPDQGGVLMDRLTVGRTSPAHGLIHAGTRQEEALRVLFHKAEMGFVNTPVSTNRVLDLNYPIDVNDIVAIDTIIHWLNPHLNSDARNFQELLDYSAEFSSFTNKIHGEERTTRMWTADLFDGIPERLSFRQNVFIVIVVAEALAPPRNPGPGQSGLPLARKRVMAIVFRDAYTGRARIRRLTPLP